jgi:hypothetical protein
VLQFLFLFRCHFYSWLTLRERKRGSAQH